MSQFDFATIDPNAKSGTQLAVDLNNWRDALHSGHRGAERPAYAQGGMLWVRETSSEQWDLMFYDGDTDFVLRSVNPTTNQLIGIPQDAVSGLAEAILSLQENKQAADPTLSALAALATGVDRLPYFTGTDTADQATLTAFARTLLDDADAAAARTTLGALGTTDIDFTIIYPNGGSEASPANITVATRYVSDNPFPGYHVICEAQVLSGGKWHSPSPQMYTATNSSGVRAAHDSNADNICIVTGTNNLLAQPAPYFDIPLPPTVGLTTAPCRVKVWKVKGAIA